MQLKGIKDLDSLIKYAGQENVTNLSKQLQHAEHTLDEWEYKVLRALEATSGTEDEETKKWFMNDLKRFNELFSPIIDMVGDVTHHEKDSVQTLHDKMVELIEDVALSYENYYNDVYDPIVDETPQHPMFSSAITMIGFCKSFRDELLDAKKYFDDEYGKVLKLQDDYKNIGDMPEAPLTEDEEIERIFDDPNIHKYRG